MRAFIFKTGLFLSILIIPFVIIGKLDNLDALFSKNENIVKIQCKGQYDSLDILFLGNSYTYSGVNTQRLDSSSMKVFNLGVATAGPYFYELLLQDYLAQVNVKPKLVFLLVSPMSFSSKADNFVAYPVHRYLVHPYSNEQLILKFKLGNHYTDLLTKSFKKGFENIRHGVEPAQPGKYCASLKVTKGFVPSDIVNSRSIIEKTEHLYTDLKDDQFDVKKSKYLIEFADRLKREGMKVVFYSLPTNMLSQYFSESYLAEYASFVQSLERQNQVLSAELPSDDRYFRNIDHLNSFGAKLVTNQLIEEIDSIKYSRAN